MVCAARACRHSTNDCTQDTRDTVKALAQADVRAKLTDMGMEVVGGTPEQLAAIMRIELPKWAKVVKESGAKLD